MTLDDAIKYYTDNKLTQVDMANDWCVSKGAISNMKRRGSFPREYQLALEAKSKGKKGALKADPIGSNKRRKT